ncbi:MAG: ADP-glyceromanno-heptose 6-epimerase [Chitinophagaceae bacterium]|nr:ADP-glyceromanno-heptose 6-epimerase [Chitinophagaceae bacterium]
MNKNSTIVVTGAAGFIGSCLVSYLNDHGFTNLILVDDFSRDDKSSNLTGKGYKEKIEREVFFEKIFGDKSSIDFVFHIGARTDTTEFDYKVHQRLNVEYSKKIWNYCTIHAIPLVYASSAATYGSGESGYNDSHELIPNLKPLNPYGESKNEFDKWVLHQDNHPPAWYGLKFFNVYGPNENHKGRMASVIFHSFNQIKKDGLVKLFKSHRPDFEDGKQLRDFIYVKDILKVSYWLMENSITKNSGGPTYPGSRQRYDLSVNKNATVESGIYNLGTGKARSFEDLVKSTFAALDLSPNIVYIDMPADIRDKYQYFTEANMNKLKTAGYQEAFYSLENGIDDYVRNYLGVKKYY